MNAGGTGLSYTTGPGGGGVTSVGLAGDATFNNIFTITTSSSNPIVNSGILTINVTNFTGTGNLVLSTSPTLVTPVLGVATATSLTASGTVTAATLNSTTLNTSEAVFTDGSKNLISRATNGSGNVVLTTSPTLVTPILGAATATSLTSSGTVTAATLRATGLTASGVVLTDGSSNLTVPANGANGTVLSIVAGVPAWSAISSLGSLTVTSLTASGTVTAATLNSTTLNASQAVFTDGSKNLISRATNGSGNVVLTTSPTLVTPNIGFATATGLVVTGGSSTDIGINLNTVVANRRISFAGANEFQYTGFGLAATALKYSVASSSADHIFYRGETSSTETELFRVKGSGGARAPYIADAITVGTPPSSLAQIAISGTGSARYHAYNGGGVVEWIFGQNSSSSHDFTFSTVVSGVATTRATISRTGEFYATPKYGIRYKDADVTVAGIAFNNVTWVDSVTGILTSDGTSLTNNTAGDLVVMVYYTVLWENSLLGGTVSASVRTNTGAFVSAAFAPVFVPSNENATCTAQVILQLPVGGSFYIFAENYLATPLDIKGGAFVDRNISRMGYYILN